MARIGKGTTIKYKSPDVTIGEIINIELPEISADDVEITTYASANNFREYMAGLKDGGEVSIEFSYNPSDAGQIALLSDVGGETKTFQITFPDNSIWEFNAYVKSFQHTAPLDDRMTGSASFKVTGKPTFTVGS